MVGKYTHFTDAFLLRRQDSAVTGNHIKIRSLMTGLIKRTPEETSGVCDLLGGGIAGVVHAGNQLGNGYKLHLCRCLHLTHQPHSAKFLKPANAAINSFLLVYAEGKTHCWWRAIFTIYAATLLLSRPIVGKIDR